MEHYEDIARNEGIAKGRAEGGNRMLYQLVQDGDLPIEKAAKRLIYPLICS